MLKERYLEVEKDFYVLGGELADPQFNIYRDGRYRIDIDADQIFLGTLGDSGESLFLRDNTNSVIDSANENGGGWPAGTVSPDFRSMERNNPYAGSGDDNWIDNDTITRNGLNLDSQPINGTPGQPNSAWVSAPLEPDLSIRKSAPVAATAGGSVSFTLIVNNIFLVHEGDISLGHYRSHLNSKNTLPIPLGESRDHATDKPTNSNGGTINVAIAQENRATGQCLR